MFWYLNKISTAFVESLDKSVEYERSLDQYCLGGDATSQVSFKPNELSAGDYILKIFAFDQSYPEEFVTFTQRLTIGASPLIVRMKNQNYIELNWNELLALDFISNSFDPDYVEGSPAEPLQFELLCIRVDEQDKVLDRVQNQIRYVKHVKYKLV
jgi:hypothetical protein